MSKTILELPDPHADPSHDNDRADWMGALLAEVKPDILINIGDTADMPSLSTHGDINLGSYEADINCHLDFQERLFAPMRKAKRKQPRRIILEGNHEYRITRALEARPELAGDRYGMSFKDLDLSRYYHNVVRYEHDTPGIIRVEGVDFAHYFIAGVMGTAIGGLNHARSLIMKHGNSCVQGHSHLLDYSESTNASAETTQALVCGVGSDQVPTWAGNRGKLWRPNVTILRNVEGGNFDVQNISLSWLKKEYGNVS